MKDRLIELIYDAKFRENGITPTECLKKGEIEVIADYLLENGVIVPPCKVGDTVYYLEGSRILEGTVKSFSTIMKDNYYVVYVETKYSLLGIERFGYWMFGKRIFLTRESAEQALKECEQG